MVKIYKSQAAAEHRVNALRLLGIWPGVIIHKNGTFTLTYDPADQETELEED